MKTESKKIKTQARAGDTEYLLSTKSNRDHLAKSIAQLNNGQSKKIKTENLWK